MVIVSRLWSTMSHRESNYVLTSDASTGGVGVP